MLLEKVAIVFLDGHSIVVDAIPDLLNLLRFLLITRLNILCLHTELIVKICEESIAFLLIVFVKGVHLAMVSLHVSLTIFVDLI